MPLQRVPLRMIHFDINTLLHQRGKVVESECALRDHTLVKFPELRNNHGLEATLYTYLNDKRNRESVRAAILNGSSVPMPWDIHLPFDESLENLYSKTFEWYVAELLTRELKFLGSGFGLQIRNSPDGGDHDVIAVSHFDIVHVECKSGRAINIKKSDVEQFIARSRFLNAEISILYIDSKQIHKDKAGFDFGMFESFPGFFEGVRVWKITSSHSGATVFKPEFLPFYIVDCNSTSGSAVENIRLAIDAHYTVKQKLSESIFIGQEDFESAGFLVEAAAAKK